MENEKMIIELLQEIKQEQQKLNQRFDNIEKRLDETDKTINSLIGSGKTFFLDMKSLTDNNLESPVKKLKTSKHETIGFEDLEVLWNRALSRIDEEVSKPSFETWMKATKLLSYNNDKSTVTIAAPNSFARDWLENHYSNLVKNILAEITGQETVVEFVIQKEQ